MERISYVSNNGDDDVEIMIIAECYGWGKHSHTIFDLIYTAFLRVVSIIPEFKVHRSHNEEMADFFYIVVCFVFAHL